MTTRYLQRSIARRRRIRLRRIWRAILVALRDAWSPPAEIYCRHGYAEDFCPALACPNFEGGR